ncbi:MAG: DsbA family protein [Anaerolineaceae bacterium]|nr:DsbA family protein [Anaerolineaceae bacterium]
MSTRRRIAKQKSKQPAKKNGLLIIGIVALVAVVAVIVLVMASRRPVAVGEFTTVEKKNWPLANGKSLGAADAPVVLREFSDYQCPYCRQFTQNIQGQIIKDYVETGKVRFEYHDYIVIDPNVGGTESRRAAEASECANEQGMFWDFHEMLFTNQQAEGSGAFSDDRLRAFAKALGLDTAKFNSCFNSGSTASKVVADEVQGKALNVRGTPSLFVNDTLVTNPLDYATVKAAIDAALNSAAQ